MRRVDVTVIVSVSVYPIDGPRREKQGTKNRSAVCRRELTAEQIRGEKSVNALTALRPSDITASTVVSSATRQSFVE